MIVLEESGDGVVGAREGLAEELKRRHPGATIQRSGIQICMLAARRFERPVVSFITAEFVVNSHEHIFAIFFGGAGLIDGGKVVQHIAVIRATEQVAEVWLQIFSCCLSSREYAVLQLILESAQALVVVQRIR